MEPKSFFPTIKGEIIQNPFREVLTKEYAEAIIMAVSFVLAGVLFFTTPSMAPRLKRFLESLGFFFETSYIQGAVERVFSAFVVTFFISFIGLIIKYFALRRRRPIDWSTIEESRL